MQRKYMFLESYLGKRCYPSYAHALLYESKSLEAFISQAKGIPYAKTHISYNKEDAIELINHLEYPFISKVDPSSGSMGVELVQSTKQARRIVEEAFSPNGRKIHVHYFRQKNHVYFQEFIPNDGYDIRVIIVGDWAFGYYRKVLKGDFRASGMDLIENKELPEEAVLTAWNANKHIRSPLLVVDMVHGLDGKYSIIEFSPTCKIGSSDRFFVNGVPCYYSIDSDGAVHLEKGFYWVHELALREFLLKHCLPYSS
jgi:glutathione synthase/RimK-type ligase-like ATP-grasp enzyme